MLQRVRRGEDNERSKILVNVRHGKEDSGVGWTDEDKNTSLCMLGYRERRILTPG